MKLETIEINNLYLLRQKRFDWYELGQAVGMAILVVVAGIALMVG